MKSENFSEEIEYEKMPIHKILSKSKKIDTKIAADQIIQWVTSNVEQFIDNQRVIYKLDLVLDHEDGVEQTTMPEVKKLQDLYRAIPDDEVINQEDFEKSLEDVAITEETKKSIDCRFSLDEVTNEIYEKMKDHEGLPELFKRMVFYYEMKGVSMGKPLIEELEGGAGIIKFEYESFPVGVKVSSPAVSVKNKEGELVEVSKGAMKEYTIPEGFTVWVEISYRSKLRSMTSLF